RPLGRALFGLDPDGKEREVVEGVGQAPGIAVRARERQRLLVVRLRWLVVREPVGEAAGSFERRLALDRMRMPRRILAHALDPLQPFAQVTAELPEAPERRSQ